MGSGCPRARQGRLGLAVRAFLGALVCCLAARGLEARPRYRHNLGRFYQNELPRALDACGTCHLPRSAAGDTAAWDRSPPHNPYGARLKALGEELVLAHRSPDLLTRLRLTAEEDADGDGVANEVEILAGFPPGDPARRPEGAALSTAAQRSTARAASGARRAWEPFAPVVRPAVPEPGQNLQARNPIDAFLDVERSRLGVKVRPEAPRATLLRRVTLDLTGLAPTPEDLDAFLRDDAPDAYERAVDRLLASPRHGERWGRHWMDVWRYSDWAGWGDQVRDSQPHVWRWRDWIVESLNADKGYDRMVLEMLAGDELDPSDPDTLRATGYLVRNFKLLSREAWMQEAVDHCAQAFLGVTLGCARCHDHMYDPISQKEYYQLRAVFEPHNVRLDRLAGASAPDRGLVARVFDANLEAPTFLYLRGDERNPVKEEPLSPGVPAIFGGKLTPSPVDLPLLARAPEKAPALVAETLSAAEAELATARAAAVRAREGLASTEKPAGQFSREEAELAELKAEALAGKLASLRATLAVEHLEDSGAKKSDPEAWAAAARDAVTAQRHARRAEAVRAERGANLALAQAEAARKPEPEIAKARETLGKASGELASAEKELAAPPTTEYTPRDIKIHPASSTGRRLALARWITSRENPLAARVAANHIWLRHFGQALAPSVNDLGLNGRQPTNPALLDWLAAELLEPSGGVAAPWSMKHLHRLIVTSSAYRLASTPDEANLAVDPDNVALWRMSSRRLEAEVVRDNVLFSAGRLVESLGGPELDHKSLLATRRRSLYYRNAAEKQAEFLKVFDMAGVSECYERKSSVVPQQALALANSELVLGAGRLLAREIVCVCSPPEDFVAAAWKRILSREPAEAELEAALSYLEERVELLRASSVKLGDPPAAGDGSRPSTDPGVRAREGLVHALLNHNDFVTVR